MTELDLIKSENAGSKSRVFLEYDESGLIHTLTGTSDGDSWCGFGTKTHETTDLVYGENETVTIDLKDKEFYLIDDELPNNLKIYVGKK